MAKRLAEDNHFSVAVIEAGGFYELDAGNFSQIPADENIFSEAPVSIDWKITTTPQSVGLRSHVLSTKDGTSDIREATRWKIYSISTGEMPWRIVSPRRGLIALNYLLKHPGPGVMEWRISGQEISLQLL